jgi:mRNA-degrading endonuclease RelE of RelBE toxin-antitoxin system
MPWNLVITKPAARDLKKIRSDDLQRINAAFEAMRNDPYAGDIKFLRGMGGTLRRRVGTWRILFDVHQEGREVVVLGVVRRTSTTY